MNSNVEIKARLRDAERFRNLAKSITDQPERILHQEDLFFRVPRGRLKLRVLAPDVGELIYYERPDHQGPKQCQYRIYRTTDPAGLKATLALSLDPIGLVRKRRTLFMSGQTRIHLDEVEGLGDFMELEFVLCPGQNPGEGQRACRELMEKLEIRDEDLQDVAYIDLLTCR